MSDPSTISAAANGKAAEDGSAGTRTFCARNSGRPSSVILRPCGPCGSTFSSAPKCSSIFSVWSREASSSITTVRPGELRPANSTADLICAEATGVVYSMGSGSLVPCSRIGKRPPSCSLQHAGALEQQRVEDAPHRPLAQRGVAVETRGDGMAADDAHHQPRSRAGVAEVERLAGGEQRAESGAKDAPISLAAPRHASRRAGGRRWRCATRRRLRADPRSSSRRRKAARGSATDARRICRRAGADVRKGRWSAAREAASPRDAASRPRLPNRIAFSLALGAPAPKIGAPRARKRSVSVLRENARGRTQIERLCAKMRAIVKNRQAPGEGRGSKLRLAAPRRPPQVSSAPAAGRRQNGRE